MKKLWMAIIFLTSIRLLSQNHVQYIDTANVPIWKKMMRDPQVNFFQTQRAFNLYWQNRPVSQGTGYNVFKRWEYITKRYIDEKGNIKRNDVEILTNNNEVNELSQSGVYGLNSIDSVYACSNDSSWQEVGPLYERNAGRVSCIAFHPKDSNTIFVGTPSGGIWKSTNGGKQWEILKGYLPSLGVSAIAINPKNPDIIYIGLSDPDAFDSDSKGIYKTIDGGKSWFSVNTGFRTYDRTVYRIIIDPDNPQIVLTSVCGGIYRTVDGGKNWKMSGSFCSFDLVVNPNDRKYVYAVSQGEFCKSSDSGKTFIRISKGLSLLTNRYAIGVSKANPSYVYLLECGYVDMENFYCSKNYGDSFAVIKRGDQFNLMSRETNGSQGSGQAEYCMDIAVNPNDENDVYVGGIMVFNSKNGGIAWKVNADWQGIEGLSVHADIHALEYNPWNGKLYAATDGGVYYQEGKNWWPLSKGLGNRQVYKISTCNNGNLLAGFQDNGSEYSTLDNTDFKGVSDGDGLDNAIDYFRPNLRYTSFQNGLILKSGSVIARNGLNGINETGDWLTPFVLVENNQNIMVAGFRNLWMSNNLDSSKIFYKNICNGVAYSSTGYVNEIESSPKDKNLILFSRGANTLFITENALSNSVTWNQIYVNRYIYDIQCDYKYREKIYLASKNEVYYSDNLGVSWMSISDSLPIVNINCLAIDSSSSIGGMYCGTSKGVYYRDDKLKRWVRYYKGFPENVEVLDLEISYSKNNPSEHRLYAGTYGRGVWKAPLKNYKVPRPKEKFSISKEAICIQDKLTCADSTIGLYLRHQWEITPASNSLTKVDSNSSKVQLSFANEGRYTIKKSVKNCLYKDSMFNEKLIVYNQIKNSNCVSKTNDVTNSGDYGINRVQINKYTRFSNGAFYSGSYEDLTCTNLIKVKKEEKLNLKVLTHPSVAEFLKVYVDFNNNGQFSEQDELIVDHYGNIHVDSIAIPSSAVLNTPLRVRFVSDVNWVATACSDLKFGQTEDYSIVIVNEQADFNANKKVVCTNETVVFNDSSIGFYNLYNWDFGEGAIPRNALGKGPHLVKYSSSGLKNVKLELNDGIAKAKASFIEVVNGNKDTLVPFRDSGNYCLGQQLLLKSKYEYSSKTKYKWYKNNIEIDTANNELKVPSISNFDTGVYFLISLNSCINDTTNSVKINVHNQPSSRIEVDQFNRCLDSASFKFKSVYVADNEKCKFKWVFSDGKRFDDSTISVTFDKPGKYNVLLFLSSQYCSDSSEVSFEVYPLPDVVFKAIKVADKRYSFIPRVGSNKTYTWDFGDGDTSMLISPVHTYFNALDYKVTLASHSNKGCFDSIQRTLSFLELKLDDRVVKGRFTISPNPTEDLVKFTLSIAEPNNVKVDILSLEGKMISTLYSSFVEVPDISFSNNLSQLNLHAGIYIVRVIIGNELSYVKLIKQ